MAATIRLGMHGQAVAMLQTKLAEKGYHVAIDGIFGPETETAVKQFQDEAGLAIDGIVGAKTIEALVPTEKPVYKAPVRHKVRDLSLAEVLERANACVGAPIKYHLHYPNGGTDPDANMPCDEQTGNLDCSGATAWWLGYDRDFKTGLSKTLDQWDGYSNTDSKIAEAEREGLIYQIIPLAEAQPGDLIVGESYRSRLTGRRVYGHEGLITAVGNVKRDGLKALAVVHCSSSNAKKNDAKSAVWKTNAQLWGRFRKVRVLRFDRDYVLAKLKQMRRDG